MTQFCYPFASPDESVSQDGRIHHSRQVELADPSRCVRCDMSLVGPIFLLVSIALVAVAMIVVYARLVARYPDALRRGISSASMIIAQLQTAAPRVMGALSAQGHRWHTVGVTDENT